MSKEAPTIWTSKPNTSGLEILKLKDEFKSLVPDIEKLLSSKGPIGHKKNEPEFIKSNGTANDKILDNANDKILHLAVNDIEGGGPQPRTRITPDDPETVVISQSPRTLQTLWQH